MLIDVSKREEQNGQEIFLLLRQIELRYDEFSLTSYCALFHYFSYNER